MDLTALTAYVLDRPVGEIFYDSDSDKFVFTYYEDAAEEDFISLTMPVTAGSKIIGPTQLPSFQEGKNLSYVMERLFPPLTQMIPEGLLREVLLSRIAKVYDIDPFSTPDLEAFLLLSFVGRSAISGRVRFFRKGEKPFFDPKEASLDFSELDRSDGSKESVILRYMDRVGLLSGIGGQMPKVLALDSEFEKAIREKRVTIPMANKIIKFQGENYPSICVIEHFCLRAAERSGLRTVKSRLTENATALVIDRFDTEFAFEEVFVLLGLTDPHRRYSLDYSVVSDLFQLTLDSEWLQKDLKDFFKMLVLSVCVRNGDAHLKNFGVIYDKERPASIRLAPVYDVVTSTIYVGPDENLALPLMGCRDWPDRKKLVRFGLTLGLTRPEAEEAIDEVVESVLEIREEMLSYSRSLPREMREKVREAAEEWQSGSHSLQKKNCFIRLNSKKKRVRTVA